jgi:hypothetical protein
MAGEIVILKKKNKLDRLKVSPNLYKLDTNKQFGYEEEEGELDGVYKGNTFLGAKRNVTPTWDDDNNKWAFDGEWEELKAIQARLKLRDERGMLFEINEDTLYNRYDPFWGHKSLWTGKIMDEGSVALNSENPLDHLLIKVHRGLPKVHQIGSEQSPYMVSDSELEILSPKYEDEEMMKSGKKQVDAVVLFSKMSYDKQKAIAHLMQLPGYNNKEIDPQVIYGLVLHGAVNNTDKYFKYGSDITYQERFVQLANYTNEKLNILTKVQEAIDSGGIVLRQSTGYTFNGEKLADGTIRSLRQLHDFYLSPKNTPMVVELDNYLEAIKK